MRADTRAGQIIAVLSRRAPAFEETAEPHPSELALMLFGHRTNPTGVQTDRRLRSQGSRGLFPPLRRVVTVSLLLVGLLYALSPAMQNAVNGQVQAIKDRVASALTAPKLVPIHPTSTTASAQLPDHPGALATDGLSSTFWEAPDAAAQPTLVLAFDGPVRLVRATVHSGDGGAFQALARPKRLRFVYFDSGTVVGVSDATLSDVPDPQQIAIGNDYQANRVAIHVLSFYPSAKGDPALALSELELYERQ